MEALQICLRYTYRTNEIFVTPEIRSGIEVTDVLVYDFLRIF